MNVLKIFQVLLCIVLLAVNSESESLPRKTFRCTNGKYILDNSFCNTYDSCGDGSDEAPRLGCDWFSCEPGNFKCLSSFSHCANMSLRCNGHKDCADGSDEAHCGDEINVKSCSLADGKFLCHDGLRCLDFEYTCDHACNCFDCSDENSNCSKVDRDLLSTCPHSYFPTPHGPMCLCNLTGTKPNKLCKELEDCTDRNICQQRCSMYKDKVQCSCDKDYVEIPGTKGFKCRSKAYLENSLVYATSSQLKILNLTNNEVSVIKTNVECSTLTAAHDNVYYATYNDDRKSIFKTSISSKTTAEVIKLDSAVTSIAADYITNNIYFTTNTSLSVCSSDGKICTQLKCCNVSYVAVAPKFGLMFYTMKSNFQDELFIVKSDMDGSNEQLLVDGTFRYPVPLTVEESIQKLYWLEIVENAIHSVSFTGDTNEVEFLKFHGTMSSFTALGNAFYYTKNRDNQIYVVENIEEFSKNIKNTNRFGMIFSSSGIIPLPSNDFRIPIEMLSDFNATKIYDNNRTMAIRDVHAFNLFFQSPKQIKNPCKESSCSGLCLLRPSSTTNQLNHICTCHDFTTTNTQSWCTTTSSSKISDFDYSPKQDAVISQSRSQSDRTNVVFITIVVLVVVSLGFFVLYSWFRRRNCYGYYDMLRNCMTKSNEQMEIYNGEDL